MFLLICEDEYIHMEISLMVHEIEHCINGSDCLKKIDILMLIKLTVGPKLSENVHADNANVVSSLGSSSLFSLEEPHSLEPAVNVNVFKDGMDFVFVDPKVVEGVDEPVSTILKSIASLITNPAVTCKIFF
ncbi:hypothetical protein Tco_1126798 [Tanacetum coccineum]